MARNTSNYKWVLTLSVGYNSCDLVLNSADAAVNLAETISESFDRKFEKWQDENLRIRIETITCEELEKRHEQWEDAHKPEEEENN